MEQHMKIAAIVVYVAFGTLALILGLAALLMPAWALSAQAYTPLTAHLLREEGALGVFVGLMAFWCFAHFDQRRPVHLALLLFAALFAAIHWAEYLNGRRQLSSPLINSIPVLALGVTAPIGRGSRYSSRAA